MNLVFWGLVNTILFSAAVLTMLLAVVTQRLAERMGAPAWHTTARWLKWLAQGCTLLLVAGVMATVISLIGGYFR